MIENKPLYEYEKLLSELTNNAYIQVPFSISSSQISDAMQAFFAFLDEPEDIKSKIDFKISQTHRRGDIGFKHRKSSQGMYNDNKDFFHFHPAILQRYPDFVQQHPIIQAFMQKALPIWEQAYRVTRNILGSFEPQHPGLVNRIYNTQEPHIILRFLSYHWEKSGHYLAKPHYDAGAFTLAIAESEAGLRIGQQPSNLKEVVHQPNHALFMLSSNFKQLIPSNSLNAAWHDVIQVDETKEGKPYARWALVAFIEAHDAIALSRSETHKWYSATQDK